jgi:BlaI family transcriptional regulator, penicillinase repressor
MPRQKSSILTEREAEIMSVLWEVESGTAEDIRLRLTGEPHDSTVRTLLRVLVSKGHVVVDSNVRPATYRARVKQTTVRKKATRDIVKRFFGGSAEALVLHLLENDGLSLQQIKLLESKYRRRTNERKSDQ